MDRKLASICKIGNLEPIDNADFIELATVKHWRTIVKKGEFEVGDKCVYFEIDSFLPEEDKYSFLGSRCRKQFEGEQGYKLSTVKLRGTLSQGLALPLHDFTNIAHFPEGKDVTDVLGIKKYERVNTSIAGNLAGNFPVFIPKTRLERVQNLNLDQISDYYEVTEKLDGTSCTIYEFEGKTGICSRNYEIKNDGSNAYSFVFNNNNFEEIFYHSGVKNVAFQGEIIGPSVQGNSYKRGKPEFYLFDVYDIDSHKYLSPEERHEVVEHINSKVKLPLKTVPYFGDMDFSENAPSVEELITMADHKSLLAKTPMEGLVFKDHHSQERFKVISNKFLLKRDR